MAARRSTRSESKRAGNRGGTNGGGLPPLDRRSTRNRRYGDDNDNDDDDDDAGSGRQDSRAGHGGGTSYGGSDAASVGGGSYTSHTSRASRTSRTSRTSRGSRLSGTAGFGGEIPDGLRTKDRFRLMRKLRKQQEAQRALQRTGGGSLAASGAFADAAGRVVNDGLRAKIEETHAIARSGVDGPADPEVHVIGEVVGGTGFDDGVACKFVVQAGEKWKLLQGNTTGQTHVAYKSTVSKMDVWAHPIDVHYVAGRLDGWPRILLQVWKLDTFGRQELQGYGFCHIPSGAGSFDVEVPTWRPVGDTTQEMAAFFLGGVPQLKDTDLLFSKATDRKYLTTTGSGIVHIHVDIVLKHMEQHGVEW